MRLRIIVSNIREYKCVCEYWLFEKSTLKMYDIFEPRQLDTYFYIIRRTNRRTVLSDISIYIYISLNMATLDVCTIQRGWLHVSQRPCRLSTFVCRPLGKSLAEKSFHNLQVRAKNEREARILDANQASKWLHTRQWFLYCLWQKLSAFT